MNAKRTLMVPAFSLIALGVQSALASSVPAPVPRAIVSASSAWGTATDTWAGYTGALNIWVPTAVTGGWTLTFRSAELAAQAPATAFWNAVTTYDPATQTFRVKAPSWGGNVSANSVLSIGFNGRGVLGTGFPLNDCTFNGQPCVATVMSAADSQQTLAGLLTGAPGASDPPPTSGSTTGATIHISVSAMGVTGRTITAVATATTGLVEVKASLRVDNMVNSGGYFDAFYVSKSGTGSDRETILYFYGNGNVRVFDGGTERTVSTWSAGNWYDVDFLFDTTAQKFNLAINGSTVATNYSFLNNTATSVNTIIFQEYGGQAGSTLYIDNVQVLIPEPAALALLALGVPLMLRRRSRA